MYMPLVSLITPTYNHAHFLGRCIDSVLAQSYSNWQLIVVDDGSTDNTEEVMSKYKDPRITYQKEKRRGVKKLAETMNIGLHKGKGELVTAIMSDDMWPAYRLEKQVPVFQDPSVVLAFGKQLIIDEFEKGDKTLVELSGFSLENIDDAVFTKAYLENLSK